MAKCSKCKTELHVGAAVPGAMPGFGMIMGGEAFDNMAENLRRQPRGCTACNRNFCSACTYKNDRHTCPQCGKDLGDINSRPTFIADAPEPRCFIATACYGDACCSEVVDLRRFRDDVLLPTAWGRMFTGLYYRLSPQIATYINHHPIVGSCIKKCLLNPIVQIIRRGRGTS
jgi:hypothetical protein